MNPLQIPNPFYKHGFPKSNIYIYIYIQVQYSILDQRPNAKMAAAANERGIKILACALERRGDARRRRMPAMAAESEETSGDGGVTIHALYSIHTRHVCKRRDATGRVLLRQVARPAAAPRLRDGVPAEGKFVCWSIWCGVGWFDLIRGRFFVLAWRGFGSICSVGQYPVCLPAVVSPSLKHHYH